MIISPLTKTEDITLLNSIDSNQLINDWRRILSIDITEELAGCNKINLYRCNKTGIRFFSPASVAGREELYVQLQKLDWYYMPWKWEHKVLFNRLKKKERILEVGCATGTFVEKLSLAEFHIEGVELNSSAVASAQAKNLPVSSISLPELAGRELEKFDVVCSFQVLEHISDPATFIENCLALLKPKGRLVICVPNNDSFLRHQYNLLNMPPHHMTQWSVEAFQALEQLYPLLLHCVKYEPLAHYHIGGYLASQKKRLLSSNNFLHLFLNRYMIPIFGFFLKKGFSCFCRGQSIYIEFLKY